LIFDLHCHSTSSDGSLTPQELILHAKRLGLAGLAITDHDTQKAYEEAIPAAKEAGLFLGAGIELSCDFRDVPIHILGYDFDLWHPLLSDLIARHQKRREGRNRRILLKLQEHKMPIAEEELLQRGLSSTLGRPHIAELLVKKGYVATVREAFQKYLGEGKLCYVRGETFSIEEAIGILHAAHGKVFLAHPHLLPKETPWDPLLDLPFDGIECFYAKFTRAQSQRWIDIAYRKKWLMSGGSDFHGALAPKNPLGCNGVDLATFNQIFQHNLY
jgi:predicted metal-dependent phosphoesterase TrpH